MVRSPLQGAYMMPLRRFLKDTDAQDLIEYGLLSALIAVFAMGAVKLMGDTVSNVLWGGIARCF